MREFAHERKVHVSGAVSGAVVALRATKTKQDTDIPGGPGRTRTCNQTVMSGGICVDHAHRVPLKDPTIAIVTAMQRRIKASLQRQ